ncbi:hypothetical protein V8C34DRAFT_297932 [Trichoderma compactum]
MPSRLMIYFMMFCQSSGTTMHHVSWERDNTISPSPRNEQPHYHETGVERDNSRPALVTFVRQNEHRFYSTV